VIQIIISFLKICDMMTESCYSLSFYIKVVSFAFQPNFPDVDVPEGDRDLLPIDTASSVAPEPEVLDHTAEHILRIAYLESQVKVFKQ
jgi:hypothetical protein